MADFIVVVVVLLIVGAAITYIVREKKRGVTCIGCPAAGKCGKSGGCHCDSQKNS